MTESPLSEPNPDYLPPPDFTDAEYRRRSRALVDRLPSLGLDAIAITYDLHVEYLTATWGSQFWIAPVLVSQDEPAMFVAREFERDRLAIESRIPVHSTYFDHDDAIEVWAAALCDLGWETARLGLELDNLDLTYRDVTELQRILPDLTIVDASHVLPRIMATKSVEELTVMETSMRYTELAVGAMIDTLRPGVTEREVRSAMHAAAVGGGSTDLRGGLTFGQHTATPHGEEGLAVLQRDDVVVTETSGYCRNYCAALCRTAVIGNKPAVVALYEVAREAVEAALTAMRPGALTGDVDRAARTVVERAGKGTAFRHRTGYSNGIWANGRLNLSLKPGGSEVLEKNMTFHTPVILFEAGDFSVSCSETAVVTEGGGVPLSRLGRELIRLD